MGPGADSRGVAGLAPARESSSGAAHPLRLSGVALAGANRRATVASGTEDGILTAEEIVALDLSGVEWVVFSACDTGRGRIEAGEGVFGLRRAAQIAGARTVILSLWAVNDEMAARWMCSLYRGRWQEGRDTISAVHAAGLELLTSLRAGGTPPHPVLWAAFVAAGRGR